MKTVGAFEAKTHLSRLLHDVEVHHEGIIITRHNRNIACLVPVDRVRKSGDCGIDLVARFKEIRSRQSKSGGSLQSLIEEGRKR